MAYPTHMCLRNTGLHLIIIVKAPQNISALSLLNCALLTELKGFLVTGPSTESSEIHDVHHILHMCFSG